MRPSANESSLAPLARVGLALGSANRLHLLTLIAQAEKSVDQLARESGLPVKNTSAQLRVLREAGIVLRRRRGTHVRYRLSSGIVATLVVALRRLAEAGGGAPSAAPARRTPEDVAVLRRALRSRRSLVLDVRPRDEYDAGHLRGAVNIPHHEIHRRLQEVPIAPHILVYCRGPQCRWAAGVARVLSQRGYRASVCRLGVLEFRAHRLPLSQAPIGRARPAPGIGPSPGLHR